MCIRDRNEALGQIMEQVMLEKPLYDFVSEDGIGHRVWKVGKAEQNQKIEAVFAQVPATYIADGHHRAASAVKVGLKRRQENPDYTGAEPFNYFLSVLFLSLIHIYVVVIRYEGPKGGPGMREMCIRDRYCLALLEAT